MKNRRTNHVEFKGVRKIQQTISISTAPQKLYKSASKNSKNNKRVDNNNNESKQMKIARSVQKVQSNKMHLDCDSQNECEAEKIIDSNYIEGDEPSQSGTIYCKTIKSPFSTSVEIDNFLHVPIFGEVNQNTFEFLDPSNTLCFPLDTKFISTSTYYPESPSCQLVSSTIHEVVYLTNIPHMHEPKKYNISKSTVVPLHPSSTIEKSTHASTDNSIKIRIPVVVGEYNIEICIEEEILFKEKVIGIKKISKNIVLANCHFTPTQLSKPLGDGTCTASNGMLSIEGFILQSIEYNAMPRTNTSSNEETELMMLHEKISLELAIQLLQTQSIHVNYPT
ncbi:BC_2427 family protein [Sporosarcina sp. YIM B06819]|uniref:BC_2427 family protein n=1 Tax=Sporosarcina sp. YIM B06819 TaxID=3081769 RepID=UPI00298CE529|nr:hypothetical protein [Sporosarcina sp. YIM B06819]